MSDTPKTDTSAKRIGELAAKWKAGEIPAITFAASAEVALDPLRELERENAKLRERDAVFVLTCRALRVRPGNALQADQVAAVRMRELREATDTISVLKT